MQKNNGKVLVRTFIGIMVIMFMLQASVFAQDDSAVRIDGKDYSPAEIMAMPSIVLDTAFEGGHRIAEKNMVVGTPLIDFLKDYDDNDVVDFISADNYYNAPVTVGEIRSAESPYVIAYEAEGKAINDRTGSHSSRFRIYGGGLRVKLLSEIRVTRESSVHWADIYVRSLGKQGLLNAYEMTNEKLASDMTRADFVMLLIEYTKFIGGMEIFLPDDVSYDAPYAAAVQTAMKYELVTGYEDGTFRPDNIINRAEMLAVLKRSAEKLGNRFPLGRTKAFNDSAAAWASQYVEWGGQTGLLEGDEKGNANAEKATTWSEGITLLSRFADLCVKNPKEAVKNPDKKLTGEESFYLDSDKAGKIFFTLSEVMKMAVKEDIYSHTSHRGFVTEKVVGVSLIDFFKSVSLSGDVVITVKTTDGFGNSC